jgi:hypothetical protein
VNYDYTPKSGTLTEPGNYVAEFYTNKDYGRDMSGDAYHFIFKFKVIAPADVPGPVINEELLKGLSAFSDLQSGYYSVTLQSLGTGKLTYAFANYAAAYNFAYQYQRGLVEVLSNGFRYKEQFYATQFEVTAELDTDAKNSVKKGYFDASNHATYITLKDIASDALSLNLNRDIVVSADEENQDRMKSGKPFLNDRIFYYTDENGEIVTETVEFRFMSVANYETNVVKLYHEDAPSVPYVIPYGMGIQQKLAGYCAPSGRYRIVETTSGGYSTEYYGIYIALGDIQASLTLEKFNGSTLEAQTLKKENHELRQTVNGFVLRSAESTLDPQTLVKIVKDGDEIIATLNHSFYIFNRGYVEAGNLCAGDILLLSNGKTVVVEKIQHEILERPTTVYNIEVAGNHNYYVASSLTATKDEFVLVHNACPKFTPDQQAVIDLAKESKGGLARDHADILVGWAKEYGINNHGPNGSC